MPSARRVRFLVFLAVLSTLVVLYITHGPEQTRSSDFYKKTVALMDSRRAAQEAQAQRTGESSHFYSSHGAQRPMAVDETSLKDRLKVAELSAKKHADEKWRDLHGNPNHEWLAKRPAQAPKEGTPESQQEPAQQPEPNYKHDTSYDTGTRPRVDGVAKVGNGAYQRPIVDSNAKSSSSPNPHATPEDPAAEDEFNRLLKLSPILIFSKSYCPYSKKAKRILTEAYTITPAPHIVELDMDSLGSRLQNLLEETTGRGTVPNILINGRSIGGGDEVEQLWKDGKIKEKITSYAGKKVQKVVENYKYGEEPHSNAKRWVA